ncbi:MAG: hypothetical protein P8Y70_14385 [Candidatus Lokiarchaeota archaeon]
MVKAKNCINEILSYYKIEKFEDSLPLKQEQWIHNAHYLTELMGKLHKESKNYDRIRNCIILLINLCFGIDSPDNFHKKGKPSQALTNHEKSSFLNLLRTELSNFH